MSGLALDLGLLSSASDHALGLPAASASQLPDAAPTMMRGARMAASAALANAGASVASAAARLLGDKGHYSAHYLCSSGDGNPDSGVCVISWSFIVLGLLYSLYFLIVAVCLVVIVRVVVFAQAASRARSRGAGGFISARGSSATAGNALARFYVRHEKIVFVMLIILQARRGRRGEATRGRAGVGQDANTGRRRHRRRRP